MTSDEDTTMERKMVDATCTYRQMKNQLLVIRVELGLEPFHDVVAAVRVLHNEGREEFEKMRGEHSNRAVHWQP